MTFYDVASPNAVSSLLDGAHVYVCRDAERIAKNVDAASRGPVVGYVRRRQTAPTLYASAKFRVTAGSTGMPGPVVVDTVIFFR